MSPSPVGLKVEGVRNITLDEPALRAHVITPPALAHIVSSRGLEQGKKAAQFKFPRRRRRSTRSTAQASATRCTRR